MEREGRSSHVWGELTIVARRQRPRVRALLRIELSREAIFFSAELRHLGEKSLEAHRHRHSASLSGRGGEGLKQRKVVFSEFWRLERLRSRGGQGWFPGKPRSLGCRRLPSHSVRMWPRVCGDRDLWCVFLCHQSYQIRTPLSGPHYTLRTSLKALRPKAVALGLRLQCTNGGGHSSVYERKGNKDLTLENRYGAFKMEVRLQDCIVEGSPWFPP